MFIDKTSIGPGGRAVNTDTIMTSDPPLILEFHDLGKKYIPEIFEDAAISWMLEQLHDEAGAEPGGYQAPHSPGARQG